ncbi:hypothetical protein J4206_01320 [Candidatus Woesearchaeota archaeon]|nr:hypothetical protein [Candidatus Woesearchaeota archaeon]
MGRKVHVKKPEIETEIIKAYLRADEGTGKTCDQPIDSDGATAHPPPALEQRVGTVEYAR